MNFKKQKDKLDSKKQNKKPADPEKKSSITGDWFYMNPNETPIRVIYEAIKDNTEVELWETAGVMEICLSPKNSLDFEEMKPYFHDPVGAEFLSKHQIQSIYMVTFPGELFSNVTPIFDSIVTNCGGFFCADTSDFYPKYPK
jgi:hypothetical protein